MPMSEAYDVRAVGVTGQMHGTILVDESGTLSALRCSGPTRVPRSCDLAGTHFPMRCSDVWGARGRPA